MYTYQDIEPGQQVQAAGADRAKIEPSADKIYRFHYPADADRHFDRIFVDIKKNVEIYIAKHNADGDRGDTTYIRVYYRDGELVEEEAESIIKETKP